MSSVDVLIKQLASLDLKTYPKDVIKELLAKLGVVATAGYRLNPGMPIIRVRPNDTLEQEFKERHLLSYRPPRYNTTYQRASTPDHTAFYGSIVPDKLSVEDFKNARLTNCLEGTKTFRDNIEVNHEKITFGKWEVTQPITLVMVCYHPPFLYEGSTLSQMNEEYLKYLRTLPLYVVSDSVRVNEFISGEFAKGQIDNDCDYLISAIYTEMAINKGFDGVVYPSVRSNGRGMNVCLSQDCADNKIKLIAAGECRIMRNGLNPEIITESSIEIVDDTKPFIFTKLKTDKELEEMWELCLQNPQLVSM